MAGRGCTISIKVLGGTNGQGETEDISLPVALHSPLEVLKQQLHELISIAPRNQVLILCDLSDPERNSDRVLSAGLDSLSLRDCGIRNGAVLTLHALGMTAERKQQIMQDAFNSKLTAVDPSRQAFALDSHVSAADANHSYNGIVFDLECKGPYEIEVYAVSIAGMLGRVRVFARDRPWEADKPTVRQTQHWWAHRENLSRHGWDCIADKFYRPSWDRPIEIRFNRPLIIGPHQRRALYCHSGLPDDLGIQYQSYAKTDVVGEDDHLRLLPGLGHTGSQPFDDVNGWYRSYRGIAGTVHYHMRWKGWTPQRHLEFPEELRHAVRTMLLCNVDSAMARSMSILYDGQTPRNTTSSSSSVGGETAAAAALADTTAAAAAPAASSSSSPSSSSPSSSSSQLPPRYTLASLPVYLIYNIMEFTHHDWFDRPVDERDAASSRRKKPSSEVPFQRSLIRQRIRLLMSHYHGHDTMSLIQLLCADTGLQPTQLVQLMMTLNDHDDDDFDDYGDDEDDDDEGEGGEDEDEDDEEYDEDEFEEDGDEFYDDLEEEDDEEEDDDEEGDEATDGRMDEDEDEDGDNDNDNDNDEEEGDMAADEARDVVDGDAA